MNALIVRIVREKRLFVLPLGIALALNVVGYAFVVHPRGVKAAGAADRATRAADARVAAERDEGAARALVAGKARADEDLAAFYQKVLPGDLESARRLTYATLPALAAKSHVVWQTRTSEVEAGEKGSRLGRLVTRMVLQGDYDNLRDFLYAVESAPEFVILDEVGISEAKANEALTLTIRLSTYYRLEAHGA